MQSSDRPTLDESNNGEFRYRMRIYQYYLSARGKQFAPTSIEDLEPRMPYLERIIRSHFPEDRDAAILELGCGYGALLYALSREGYRNITGIDHSSEQITAAKNLGIEAVKQGDLMEELSSTPDGALDVVVAFDLVEHLTKNELIDLVDEVHRVLKSKGKWIIHVPNAEGPFGSRIRYGDFTHELAFTRQSIAQVLIACGFSTVSCFEDCPVSHGLKSSIRAVIWQVIRLFWLFCLVVETGDIDRQAIFSQNLLAVARKSH